MQPRQQSIKIGQPAVGYHLVIAFDQAAVDLGSIDHFSEFFGKTLHRALDDPVYHFVLYKFNTIT
jgi:hypothetical protein